MTLAIEMTIKKFDVFYRTKYKTFDIERAVLGRSAYSAQKQHEEFNPNHTVIRVLDHIPDPDW